MRVNSVNSYYIPNTMQVKKTQNNLNTTNFSGKPSNKRAQTALFLYESKKELSKIDKKLLKLKLKALRKKHPNYMKIQDAQADYDLQEDLVKSLLKEYKKMNPSGKNYERDIKKGRALVKQYQKTHNSQNVESEAPEGKTIGEVIRSSVGDWPFYTP